jgi:hypothetical protein
VRPEDFAVVLPGPARVAQAAFPLQRDPGPAALEQLWPFLVRRVAWEGDVRRGSMRLELGAGALSGATLLLRCDGGRVHVTLTDPGGGDLEAWRGRIGARLLAAGLPLDGVD